jgi:2-phospho-L-lactate guanylyltransferase
VIITVIPAKPFEESKRRLAPILSSQQRSLLSQNLLAHTILIASKISQVVVVSRSATVRQVATQLGTHALGEKQADLNAAIGQGIAWGQAQGASSALALPLDLPLLTTTTLADLVNLGLQCRPSVVIAPCRHHQGTNALFLNPPTLMAPHFGPNSFALHQKLAQKAGILPKIYDVPELAFDLDTPTDWQTFVSSEAWSKWNLFVSQFV